MMETTRVRALAVTPTLQKLKYLPLKESIKKAGNKITYYLLQLSGTIVTFVLHPPTIGPIDKWSSTCCTRTPGGTHKESYIDQNGPPLWSSGQSSWLHNGDVL
jgi:hypothetical protein